MLSQPEATTRAPLCTVESSYPWDTLALDYLSMQRPGDIHLYILVIVDLFSRFAFAVPTTVSAFEADLTQQLGVGR